MTAVANHTLIVQQIAEAYLRYLKNLRLETAEELHAYAETVLCDFIRMYYDPEFTTIYSQTDSHYYQRLRNSIARNKAMRQANEESEGELSQSLRRYAEFLASSFNPLNAPNMSDATEAKAKTKAKQNQERTVNDNYSEGALRHIEAESRYRNPNLRQACVDHWGYQCQCCGFDFATAYGKNLGEHYIEVHHLRPISTYKDEHSVNPIKDLVPLCANCHAMIHRDKHGVLSLTALRRQHKGKKWPLQKTMNDDEP